MTTLMAVAYKNHPGPGVPGAVGTLKPAASVTVAFQGHYSRFVDMAQT